LQQPGIDDVASTITNRAARRDTIQNAMVDFTEAARTSFTKQDFRLTI
jgi:hypothetical protein